MSAQPKTEADFFREEIEATFARYSTLSVYAAIGALEVVKAGMLDALVRIARNNEGTTEL